MNRILSCIIILVCTVFAKPVFAQVPAMASPPTVGNITSAGADLAGTVSGSATAVTDRGFIIKTSSPVLVGDPKSSASVPTGNGSFTLTPTLTPGTQYFFVSYGTNTGGTAISAAEASFYTLAALPTAPVTNLAATATSSSISLSFDAPSSLSAAGYAVYRAQASSISGITSFTNGQVPPASPPGCASCTLLGTTATSASVSFVDNTASPNTQYSYALIPFGFNGNAATYNFNSTSYAAVTLFSLSPLPIGQPTFTTSTVTGTQVDLTFNRAPNHASIQANGYAIYRVTGGTNPVITAGNLPNAAAPASPLPDGSVFVGSTITSSFTDNSAVVGNQYRYSTIPFGYNGTNAGTYNYFIPGYNSATAFTTLPTITTPQATSINTDRADLGGTITGNGNNTITERGTDWSTTAGFVFPTANKAAEGGTSIAAFSDTRSSMPSGTRIYYRAYATSVAGTATTSESSFFTFSNTPGAQPGSVTATPISSTQINLVFSPFSSISNATGYIIIRDIGTDPDFASNPDGSATGSLPLAGSTQLVAVINSSSATTFPDNNGGPGLTPGTDYHYSVIPFNWDGVNTATINYRQTGQYAVNAITFANNSAIVRTGGNSGTTQPISYSSSQSNGALTTGNSVSLATFQINDLGVDGKATTLSSITFSLVNNSNVRRIAIFDSGGNNRDQIGAPGASVSFSGAGLSNISANDGGNDTFTIRATFFANVVDQAAIDVAITAASASSTGSGISTFSAATTVGLNRNKIQVTANQLAFFYSGAKVATLPNTIPTANFASPTNVFVSAVDNLGSVQSSLGAGTTATLSLTSGTGVLASSDAGGLVKNLINGSTSWTNLTISVGGGSKTIGAEHSGSLGNGSASINVFSSGVAITPGSVASLCNAGEFQPISAISITETDPADFATGGSVILSLPLGFRFNTTLTAIGPTLTGNEISGASNYSYPASNQVQFSYSASGTSDAILDKIVLSGLQANYVGTLPNSGNLLRTGGTASIIGNASTSLLPVNAAQSATLVTFGVQELAGNPTVQLNQTQFAVTAQDVQLIGSPAGGVFSGNVTFSAGIYKFSPGTVGVGSHVITYTYTEPTSPRCVIIVQKTFNVVANIFSNLLNKYCTTDAPSTGLSVSQPTVDAVAAGFGFAPSTVVFDQALYWDFGTWKPMGTTFDPTNPIYQSIFNAYGGIYIGIRYKTNPGGVPLPDSPWAFSQYVFVRVFNSPVLTFSLPAQICVNATPINLSASVTPVPFTAVTDVVTGTGVTNPSALSFIFTPSSVPGASSSPQVVSLTYSYTNPNVSQGNCSRTITRNITVNPVPAAPPLANTNSPLLVCKDNLPAALSANAVATTTVYSWYKDIALGAANRITSGTSTTFTPVTGQGYFDNTTIANYPLFLTQTINGCESPSTTLNISVVGGPTLTLANSSVNICSGGFVDISLAGTSAILGGGATVGTWSGGAGVFTSGTLLASASTYQPTVADRTAGAVVLTLTTNQPNPACLPASKTYTAIINPIPPAPAFINPSPAAITAGTIEFCDNGIDPKLVAKGAGTGTISFYKNNLSTILSGNVPDQASNPATYFYNFNPATERDVTLLITQTVGQAGPFVGCTSPSASLRVLLHPLPSPRYSVSQFCLGTPTQFTDNTDLPIGPVGVSYVKQKFAWTFGDINNGSSGLQSPVYTYPGIGQVSTSLTVTTTTTNTNFSCTATSTALTNPPTASNPNLPIIEIGPVPQTGFSFNQQCFGDNTTFNYSAGSVFDNLTPGRTIKTWLWDFDFANAGTNTLTQTAPPQPTAPTFSYPKPGSYNVKLTLTSGLGCEKSIEKNVYILPKIVLNNSNQFSYNESFENNTNAPTNNNLSNFGGWASETFIVNANSSSTPSWNLVTPNGGIINKASERIKAWVAGLLPTNNALPLPAATNTYNINETSALNSPCFDIRALTKPVISFDYIADTWTKNDGAYLQVSLDNGFTWNTLGRRGKGLNWYNNAFITGLAGNGTIGQATGQEGWDGQLTEWTTSRYTLGGLSLIPTVRFRFYFGSQSNIDQSTFGPTATRLPYNGFGLDNVSIQNSNRTVLAESFSNSSATGAGTFDLNFSGFQSGASQQSLVKIQYRTSFGGPDPDNLLNPADPMARAALYGLTNLPSGLKGFIDGSDGQSSAFNFNGNIAGGTPPSSADNYFETQLLVTSPLTIKLTPTIIGNSINIKADINTLQAPLPTSKNEKYIILAGIVELKNGIYILRKLLPDASGTNLTALAANATQSLNYLWQVSAPLNPNNLFAVSFVQEISSKKILQATIEQVPTAPLVTGIEPTAITALSFFPVPADKELSISLGEAALTNTPVLIYDAVGKAVHQTMIDKGQQSKTVSTQDFAPGVYIIQLETDKGTVRKKVMVAH